MGSKRVIRFRAWDKELKVMYPHVEDWYDTLSEKAGEPEQSEQSFGHLLEQPERYEVMQFTGLHDRNGKEIYEGDVVRFNVAEGRIGEPAVANQRGIVSYSHGAYSFGNWCCVWCLDPMVIGNIHENPELLNAQ